MLSVLKWVLWRGFRSGRVFIMPNFIGAMFPVVGSIVMGVVHSLLYVLEPSLLPLVVAHVTFFMLAII